MAKHPQPVAMIEPLIEELRNVLSRWDTSVLKGQMIIKFGNTSAPDYISYQPTACTSNVAPELPAKILHYNPLPPNLSNFSEEDSFRNSQDTLDPTRQLRQTFPQTCYIQDGSTSERRSCQMFDSSSSNVLSDVTHVTLQEKCLYPYSVTSSHFSYATTPAPSELPYTSPMPCENTLPPFENIMLEKKSHSVESILNDSENVHEQNFIKIQTLPQTCCNNLNTFHDVTAERSSTSFNHVVEEVVDSRLVLSTELEHEMNTVTGSISSSNHQDGSCAEKKDGRRNEITNVTTLPAVDKGLSEMNSYYACASSCTKKRIEDCNESAFEEDICSAENKSQFSYTSEISDSQISVVDFQNLSHSELVKIVVNLLHLKEARQNQCISLRLDAPIDHPQEMKTTSKEVEDLDNTCLDRSRSIYPLPRQIPQTDNLDLILAIFQWTAIHPSFGGRRNQRETYSPKFSTSDKAVVEINLLSSAKADKGPGDDMSNRARKETCLDLKLETNSSDTNVLVKHSGHSDSDQTYGQSASLQNVKPLKKRTPLCTNFKELSYKSHETEDLPGNTDGTSQQSQFHINKEKSTDTKARVPFKQRFIKKSSFICKICKSNFTTRNDYRQHLRSHDGSFKCNVCGKIMKTKDSLYHHQRGLHSKVKPYHCKDCGIYFNFHHSYKLHLQKHRGERPHKCKYCEKGYLTLYHLKEHVQAVHSNACIVCHICGKKFSYNSALKLHLHRHSGDLPHQCSLCPKKFPTKNALKIHSISHIKEKNFQCETCGKCFKSEYSRNFHSKKHKKKQLKRYMCDICGKTFTFKCILDSHVQIHNKLRPYVCNMCAKAFKSKASLYTHQYNVHKDGPRFPCSICGKLFKTKSCLTAHVKRHQNENIYTCSTCSATFPDKGGLNKHMKTIHLPHKCFICKICGKTGTRGDNMRTHVKSHKNEISASRNPRDFIIEEMATGKFSDFRSHVMKVRQRNREPKHQSGRKLYPPAQTSDQNKWIQQPGPTLHRNVNNVDANPTSSSISVFPMFSQGPVTGPHSNFHISDSTAVLSSPPMKEYNGSLLSSDHNKPTSTQFLSYYCQPDTVNNNNNATNYLAIPTGSLTSLLSTINGTPEPEAPPPYTFIISPHHHNYQTTVGNSHSSEAIISRPVESLNLVAFGNDHHEQTLTTLQNVPLRIPPNVEESQVSSSINTVQAGLL